MVARRGRWLAVLAAGAALVVVPAAAPAEAHNVLRSTSPSDGASVASAPEEVVLTFDQPALALGTQIVVAAPDGNDVADGAPRLLDATVHQRIAGTLPPGTYTVDWRVTSADGHPVSGTFRFTATQATTRTTREPTTPTPTTATTGPGGSGGPGRVGGVIGTTLALVAAGGGLLALVLLRRARRRA